jgi:DNA-3-methyladenine glycosylase II
MMTSTPSLEQTIEAACSHLSDIDAVMAAAIARVGVCTLVPNPDIFEGLVDAIISQQISVKAADTMMARLRAALPTGQITPEGLILLKFEHLRALGLTTPKANYLCNLTEQVMSGQLNLAQLHMQDDETVIETLVALKGIGRWTAEMILIFNLGRPDVLPVDDLGFVEGVREAYGLPARPTRKELLARGELWRPYRTFATWYIWGLRRLSQRNERNKTRIVSL